jgi:transcriptional regulatory protein RtcR
MIRDGKFREDLLARINLWTYQLPSLKERIEDLEPNLDYELTTFSRKAGHMVSFNTAARRQYLSFATSAEAEWSANFRDLNSSVKRMATLAPGGRISALIVRDEIARLKIYWGKDTRQKKESATEITAALLGKKSLELDLFDHIQIAGIAQVCKSSKSMADAGRKLFGQSRIQKRSVNDSHRLKQILKKYDLEFGDF